MSGRIQIFKLFSSSQICRDAFLKRWLKLSGVSSYFHLIVERAKRELDARKLDASAKQETWQIWVRLAHLARPPHPSRCPSRSLFLSRTLKVCKQSTVTWSLMTEVTWQDTLVLAHPQFLFGPGSELSLSPTSGLFFCDVGYNQQNVAQKLR